MDNDRQVGDTMTKTLQLFGGDWTEEKLEIVSEYLAAYNKVLKDKPSKERPFKRVYVDAFAGTGYREERVVQFSLPSMFSELSGDDPQKFLKGSAALALEAEPSFDRYVFVENNSRKTKELEKLKETHPGKAGSIEIVTQDANEFVKQYCRCENWRETRAVLFLDPFATQVEWTTIEAVARTAAIDLWILFPLMAVNRLLANDPAKAFRDSLDRIFGTREWFSRFYQKKNVDDVFGQRLEVVEKACDSESIGQFFLERLRAIFADVAPKPRLFSGRGGPLFLLFFAAGNPKGAPIAVKIAKHLLERI